MVKTAIARTLENRPASIIWDQASPLTLSFESQGASSQSANSQSANSQPATVSSRHGRFVGGRSDGVEIVQIDTGAVVVDVLPTRGMAIWRMQCRNTMIGWQSPVAGPVHPALVPIDDPSGLGWLEGFDELVVRCGLHSNGAPEHDNRGQLVHPLHGRIGNLPADSLEIEFDPASGRIELIGTFRESRLFFSNLRLRSRIRFQAGSPVVELLDDVTNEKATADTIQMLYHINVGAPLLESGAKVVLPIDELAPKDSLSAGEIDGFDTYGPPQVGYTERVYFAKLRSDETGLAPTLIHNAEADKGLVVTYSTKTLPRFIVWKNTADLADGYVTGLEPATNYPNVRSFEESQQRVFQLQPGQTTSFRVKLEPVMDSESVQTVKERIAKVAGDEPPTIHTTPRPGWTPGA